MKISFPTTQDGWLKLGELIFAKSQNLGSEPAINPVDADPVKVGSLQGTAKKQLAEADQLHKDGEDKSEHGLKDLDDMESEIRRVAKVLSGRHKGNLKHMGAWGFTIDESSDDDPASAPPAA